MLGYLTQASARAVAGTITESSAAGSRFAAPQVMVDESLPHYRALKHLAFGAEAEQRDLRGLRFDAMPPEYRQRLSSTVRDAHRAWEKRRSSSRA